MKHEPEKIDLTTPLRSNGPKLKRFFITDRSDRWICSQKQKIKNLGFYAFFNALLFTADMVKNATYVRF